MPTARDSQFHARLPHPHLLKHCHALEDPEGDRVELGCVRNSHGRELDFVMVGNDRRAFAVECKTGERGGLQGLHGSIPVVLKGMIYSPTHGDMAFTVPLLDGFMQGAVPEMLWICGADHSGLVSLPAAASACTAASALCGQCPHPAYFAIADRLVPGGSR